MYYFYKCIYSLYNLKISGFVLDLDLKNLTYGLALYGKNNYLYNYYVLDINKNAHYELLDISKFKKIIDNVL